MATEQSGIKAPSDGPDWDPAIQAHSLWPEYRATGRHGCGEFWKWFAEAYPNPNKSKAGAVGSTVRFQPSAPAAAANRAAPISNPPRQNSFEQGAQEARALLQISGSGSVTAESPAKDPAPRAADELLGANLWPDAAPADFAASRAGALEARRLLALRGDQIHH